ncbi:MAG: invasion associated locus B family protein, partial [Hyphomicrobiales bacterium]
RNGVTYAVDKGKAKRAPFSVCIRQGCQAIFPASAALLKSLKKGGELRLQVTGANGKNVQIGIDLKGFTKANKSTPLPTPEQAVGQVRPVKPPLRKSTKGDAPSQ